MSFITSDAKRKAEVHISKLSQAERIKLLEAKSKELDQWISHAIFEIVSRAGVPISRIMPMRWVLTWKLVNDENSITEKAKARLVVKRLY